MKRNLVVALGFLCFSNWVVAEFASYEIGGTNIYLGSPAPGFEEACADPAIKEYVSKSTDGQSGLITCYANIAEWSKGEGTVLHKVEIAKMYEARLISSAQFTEEKNKIHVDLKKYNNTVLKTSGKLTDAQIASIDAIKNSSDLTVDVDMKNMLMREFDSSDHYILIGNSNKVMVNGEEKSSHALICFLLLKGKILTLKSTNTVQGEGSLKTQLEIFKQWIDILQAKNG